MRTRALVLLAGVTLVCGCFGTSWQRSVAILKDRQAEVELERMFESGAPKDAGFAHPANIPTEHLAAFFDLLKYEQPKVIGRTEYTPLVSETLVDTLSLAIAEGIARAGPAERVRFSVVNTRYEFTFIPKARTTRGVAFVKPPGTLNVAFDLVDKPMETDIPGEYHANEWGDPTRYAITQVTLLLPRSASLFRDENGEAHPLWVVVPVETLASYVPPSAPGKEPE